VCKIPVHVIDLKQETMHSRTKMNTSRARAKRLRLRGWAKVMISATLMNTAPAFPISLRIDRFGVPGPAERARDESSGYGHCFHKLSLSLSLGGREVPRTSTRFRLKDLKGNGS